MGFLDRTFYGNPVLNWLIALGITVAGVFLLRLVNSLISRYLNSAAEKSSLGTANLAAGIAGQTQVWMLLLLCVYAASSILVLPPGVSSAIARVVAVGLAVQAGFWGNGLISRVVSQQLKLRLEADDAGVATITFLGFIARLMLWLVVLAVVLNNLGVNITALVAGLGITGVAVAIALQRVIAELFGSLSILLDKPFVIGDTIMVDNCMGTVEHIGLKSTRVRSISGEQLIFSNSSLLNSRIHNYKNMRERRVVFSIGVPYETPYEKLLLVPGLLREIVEAQALTRFERAHFKEYGNQSLVFEIVYYVVRPDYQVYTEVQQAINLAILRRFREEGIGLSPPS